MPSWIPKAYRQLSKVTNAEISYAEARFLSPVVDSDHVVGEADEDTKRTLALAYKYERMAKEVGDEILANFFLQQAKMFLDAVIVSLYLSFKELRGKQIVGLRRGYKVAWREPPRAMNLRDVPGFVLIHSVGGPSGLPH